MKWLEFLFLQLKKHVNKRRGQAPILRDETGESGFTKLLKRGEGWYLLKYAGHNKHLSIDVSDKGQK